MGTGLAKVRQSLAEFATDDPDYTSGSQFCPERFAPTRDAVWSKSRRYAAGIGFINYETFIQVNAKFCPRDGSGEKLGFKN